MLTEGVKWGIGLHYEDMDYTKVMGGCFGFQDPY